MPPQSWLVRAVNLPEHADNPVHTDVGARLAGFPLALVAGVTTYAVMTRPIVADDATWLRIGAGELRLRLPVFNGDLLELVPVAPCGENEHLTIEAQVSGSVRATLTVLPPHLVQFPASESLSGLEPMVVQLVGSYATYGTRCGDDLDVYREGAIHPSVWLNLANRMYADQLVNGPWVHTRSRFVHHDVAHVGDTVVVSADVTRRFRTSAGERAVAMIHISGANGTVVVIEHEAIVSMTPGTP